MDLKAIELEFLRINGELNTFLEKTEQDAASKLEPAFNQLKLDVVDKANELSDLEVLIGNEIENTNKLIREHSKRLEEIRKNQKEVKYNLDDATVEFQKQRDEELKPFLATQKRKKTETVHKLTAQKRELSFLLKDNTEKLQELEKNYRTREVELTRRLDSNLERLSENTTKLYSDIEKNLFHIDDPKEIKSSQKKINTIRLAGLKDFLEFKNRFNLDIYENTLNYKKSKEKLELDKISLTEEFNKRIKELELEKYKLDIEEEEVLALKEYEIELKLKELEKENHLDDHEFEKNNFTKLYNVHEDIYNDRKVLNQAQETNFLKFSHEVQSFDKGQVTNFILNDNLLLEAYKTSLELTFKSLNEFMARFSELFNIISLTYLNRRKAIFEEFINLLVTSKFLSVKNTEANYQNLFKDFKNSFDDYLKTLTHNYNTFVSNIKTMQKNFEKEFNVYKTTLYSFIEETDKQNNIFYNEIMERQLVAKKNFETKVKEESQKQALQSKNVLTGEQQSLESNHHSLQVKTDKVLNEFNIYRHNLLKKQESLKQENKEKINEAQKDFENFLTKSKAKVADHKKIHNTNISNHEKVEASIYKEALKQNRIEYKNRLESL